MIEAIVGNVQLFLLIFFRAIAMIEVAPMLSSASLPQVAKIGLGFFAASAVFPWVLKAGYPIPSSPVEYFLLVVGEVLIGLLLGFMLLLVFTVFEVAGQFFSLQMGFSASEVFDPLAQVEVPLMGEYLSLVALAVFVAASGGGRFLYIGMVSSFEHLRAVDLVLARGGIAQMLIRGLSGMFQSALTVSFPILGTLVLVSITTGLLARAAPQMDILTMGFPLAIIVSFLVLLAALPYLMTGFGRLIDTGIEGVAGLVGGMAGGSP